MNVQVTTLPHSQVSLEIEVDSATVGQAIDRAYQRLSQRVSVPGFRKGKAPRAVLEAAIGRGAVLEEAADIAINDGYRQALEQTGLEPISTPEIDLQDNGIDPSQPLRFKATFYVQPTVELGDYRSIRVEPPKTEISDEAVEEAITRMAEAQAPWEPVEDRAAELGDVAIIKVVGTVDGETVIDQDDQEHLLAEDEPGEESTLNLTPHLLGLSVGESRDFEITLPATFEPAQYAGKTMACHVELKRLERRAAPVVDDAFARSLGEFDNLDALRERVRSSMQTQQQMDDAEAFVEAVMKQALERATVDVPPPLVEEEIDRTIDNLKANLESRQRLPLDLYLRLTGKTMDDLRNEVRDASAERVKSNLVLEAIADAEHIEAPRDVVDAEVRELAALPTVRERDRRRVLTSPTVRGRVETRIKRRLALQRLLQIANPKDESSDTSNSAAEESDALLQQAAESHTDALDSQTYQEAGEGER